MSMSADDEKQAAELDAAEAQEIAELDREFDEAVARAHGEDDAPIKAEKEADRVSSSASAPVRATEQTVAHQQPVTPPPAVAPPPTEAPSTAATPVNTPGSLVLQWLAYASWGWFAVSMLWLIAVDAYYFVFTSDTGSDIGEAIAYPIAAVIVLTLISLPIDYFYARKEPAKKTGAATIIMVIHAVIFALCAIGALITAVFAMVNTALNAGVGSGRSGATVVLISSLAVLAVYVVLLVRTLLVGKVRHIRVAAWGVLLISALIAIILGIAGPALRAAQTKQDRLIESSLPNLASSINAYAKKNNALPTQLSEVTSYSSYNKAEVKELVSQNIVRYTPNTKPATSQYDSTTKYPLSNSSTRVLPLPVNINKVYYYKLCVTYRYEKSGYGDSYVEPAVASYNNMTTISTYDHPAGEKCYDVQTDYTFNTASAS